MDEKNSQNSDGEKINLLTESIFRAAVLSSEEVAEIADSPRLWWHLQSRIATEKVARQKRRLFVWGWITATAFAALAIFFGVVGGIWLSVSDQSPTTAIAEQSKPPVFSREISSTNFDAAPAQKPIDAEKIQPQDKVSVLKAPKKASPIQPRTILPRKANLQPKTFKNSRTKTEFATDFIALSHLPAAESGQIVRVKVPRTMMVSLGISTNVERDSELIDAEVILADDGAARAIRFLK